MELFNLTAPSLRIDVGQRMRKPLHRATSYACEKTCSACFLKVWTIAYTQKK